MFDSFKKFGGNNEKKFSRKRTWRNLFRSLSLRKTNQVAPSENVDKARNIGAAFSEHHWDIEKLSLNNPTSRINIHDAKKSVGLSASDANEYLAMNGPNALPKPKQISDFMLFAKQFANLLWVLLVVTDVLAFIGFALQPSEYPQLIVGVIIGVMIIGMCFTSYLHEREAHKVVQGFQNLLPEDSVVIRESNESTIPAENLVVGDVIWIKNGMRVPADVRIIYCRQLKLETSSITGEAEPLEYTAEAASDDVALFDARNIAFNGSLCVDGEGMGIVIRTGTDTVIGQIANLTIGQTENKSQLQTQMRRFIIFLTIAATVISVTVFVTGGFTHNWHNPANLLCMGFIACAIGTVPVGMPATVTSIIALVARRLAKQNVFLKRLDIVEALGSVTIIASDKTGTLTKNVMTVTDVWYFDTVVQGLPERKNQKSILPSLLDRFKSPLKDMIEIMTVCNASKFVTTSRKSDCGVLQEDLEIGGRPDPSQKIASGAPSEIAMLRYVDKLIHVDKLRAAYNIVYEVPFNSKREWHLMIAKMNTREDGTAEYKLMIKGASEILVKHCTKILTNEGIKDLDQDVKVAFHTTYEQFGASGRRVIGFAMKTLYAADNFKFDYDAGNITLDELTFVGISAIMDPPRDETAGAVEECRTAGIKVFMVTGDHHLTAAAIAREINLIQDIPGEPKNYEVLHGESISNLTEREWDEILQKQALVFARTTPEQKLLIVEQCQKRKYNIAMTGDGVNDSPALKKADIGIAMGSGSDVAKQAADIILMDDNFSSIVRGVKEGRMMFDNIKKLLAYLTLHATPEIWPIVINFAFGMPLGLTSLQIISIDLLSELAPGISMSQEPAEGDIMFRPPRRREKFLVSKSLMLYSYIYGGLIQSAGCFLAYLSVYWYHNFTFGDLWMKTEYWTQTSEVIFDSVGNAHDGLDQYIISCEARGAWHVGIVMGQFFHLLCVRTRRQSIFTHGIFVNWRSLASMGLEVVILIALLYISVIAEQLGARPPPWTAWTAAIGMGVVMFTVQETRKLIIRHFPDSTVCQILKW